MRPFPYQAICLDALEAARARRRKKALIVMATGLGKTVVAGFDLKKLLKKAPGRVLFLSHDKRINAQAQKTFQEMLGPNYSHGNFNGAEKHLHGVDFLYATLQTMANHRESFDRREFKYIVLDEAHHSEAVTYKPTLKYFLPEFLLALTATPERGDGINVSRIFGTPVYSIGVFEALAKSYLCNVDYRVMTDEIQNRGKLDTPVGKLSIAELNRSIFIPKRDEEIARIIIEKTKEIKSPRVMIFCASIAHAQRMALLMPHAAVLHSGMTDRKEVERTLNAFRTGRLNTVLTVDMLNEGIDVPEANMLVFLRSTASRTIFLQQLGRGLRRAFGKESVLVLDFVANCERIEMVDWFISNVRQETTRSDANPMQPNNSDGSSSRSPVSLEVDGVAFDERLLKLMPVIREIREGYTRESVILEFRNLARELGRTPVQNDIDQASSEGRHVSMKPIRDLFGTFNGLLTAAGFELTQGWRTEEEKALQGLRDLAAELGHTPSQREIDTGAKLKKCMSSSSYAYKFGSLTRAFELAGITPRRKVGARDEDVLAALKAFTKELGHVPTVKEVQTGSSEGKVASPSTLGLRFGSFKKALQAANLDTQRIMPRKYSDEEILLQLNSLITKLGHRPRSSELKAARRAGECVSIAVIIKWFGSVDKAFEMAEQM